MSLDIALESVADAHDRNTFQLGAHASGLRTVAQSIAISRCGIVTWPVIADGDVRDDGHETQAAVLAGTRAQQETRLERWRSSSVSAFRSTSVISRASLLSGIATRSTTNDIVFSLPKTLNRDYGTRQHSKWRLAGDAVFTPT